MAPCTSATRPTRSSGGSTVRVRGAADAVRRRGPPERLTRALSCPGQAHSISGGGEPGVHESISSLLESKPAQNLELPMKQFDRNEIMKIAKLISAMQLFRDKAPCYKYGTFIYKCIST